MNRTSITSIGIIMDGNRRWAKAQGLPTFEGHRAGFEVIQKLSAEASRLKETYGLEFVTLYALSTENWKRAKDELEYLMGLFEEGLRLVIADAIEKGKKNPDDAIRVRVAGQRERFSPVLQQLMNEAERATENFGGVTVVFALSYGGRAEILEALEKMRTYDGPISEEAFGNALWTAGVPDPDLIIRTNGEYRLSNFLPWQSVYSELFFSNLYWPDFSVEELEKIFEEFFARKRNYGS